MINLEKVAASFRDPSGFLFRHQDIIYRQINQSYRKKYQQFMSSGLYSSLVEQNLLVPHKEVNDKAPLEPEIAFKVLKPKLVPFKGEN